MRDEGFGNRLKEACSDADLAWKQTALGKAFGVSPTMAWHYMKGEKKPSMDKAVEIATILNICTEWLLSGRGPKRPSDLLDIHGFPEEVKVSVATLLRSLKKARQPDG